MKRLEQIRAAMAIVTALVVAVAVAACGGSSSSSSGSGAKDAAANARTAFTTCLKQHGVTLPSGAGQFKRGSGRGGLRNGGAPSGGIPGGSGTTGSAPGAGTSGSAPGKRDGSTPGAGSFAGGLGAGGFGDSKVSKAIKACESKLPASERGRVGGTGPGDIKGPGNFRPSFSTATLKKFVACIRKHGYAAMPEPSKNANGGFFPKRVETNAAFKKALPKCEAMIRQGFKPPAGTSESAAG